MYASCTPTLPWTIFLNLCDVDRPLLYSYVFRKSEPGILIIFFGRAQSLLMSNTLVITNVPSPHGVTF